VARRSGRRGERRREDDVGAAPVARHLPHINATAEPTVLQQAPIYAYIPVKDLARARKFYEEKLGFANGHVQQAGVHYDCDGGTAFFMYVSENAGTNKASQAFWMVLDVRAEVAELRARGVVFEHYDSPNFRTVDGIATGGGAMSAWFKDTEGNTLAIVQAI
jgi:predicted enzyme related to lactoylglutathione lyase